MGGHGSHPLGWTVLVLVVVTYAHVILELAAAGLALAIAVRILGGPATAPLSDRLARCQDQIGRRPRDASIDARSMARPVPSGRASECRRPGEK